MKHFQLAEHFREMRRELQAEQHFVRFGKMITVQVCGVVLFRAQRLPVDERIHAGEVGDGPDEEFAICVVDREKETGFNPVGVVLITKGRTDNLPTKTAVELCDGS